MLVVPGSHIHDPGELLQGDNTGLNELSRKIFHMISNHIWPPLLTFLENRQGVYRASNMLRDRKKNPSVSFAIIPQNGKYLLTEQNIIDKLVTFWRNL